MQDTTKRTYLEIAFAVIVVIGSILFIVLTPSPKGKVYDCSLSEISPDYPVEVRNECRKIRAENFSKDLQKPK